MAIHSSTIAWKIPWTEEPGRLQSMGLQRVGHNWATSFHTSIIMPYIYLYLFTYSCGLPWWHSGKEFACQCRRHEFKPYVALEKEMATLSSILAGKSHGQRSMAGYSLWGCKRVRYDWVTNQQIYSCTVIPLLLFLFCEPFSYHPPWLCLAMAPFSHRSWEVAAF